MAIQTAEDTAEDMADETATIDALAPTGRFEPCAEFRLDHDSPWAACDTCGWLDDDHGRLEAPGAVVTELPRRVALVPERKAS
jgi:hypothetical protein